jgi:glyoxylase-like metal-dependent hydrolase (beta-lactamase superfamily II)
VRRGEWEDATHPHPRNQGSYLADNILPLAEAGVLELVDQDQTIMPGVRVQRTGGHTAHHQMVWIESGARRAAYAADLMPTTAHLRDAWGMGIDLYPVETMTAKQAFVREALSRETLVLFDHDPAIAAGILTEPDGTRRLTPTP